MTNKKPVVYVVEREDKNGGKACPYKDNQQFEQACTDGCPVDCVGKIVDVGQCDCSTNKKQVMYVVERKEKNGGEACPYKDNDEFEEACTDGCPVDCVGRIEDVGECDCSTNKKQVIYVVESEEKNGGKACPYKDNHEFEEACSDGCPVDCVGRMEDVDQCDCTTNKKQVIYVVEREEQFGGAACPHADNEEFEQSCNDGCPVDCIGEKIQGDCNCDTGTRPVVYNVTQKEQNGGKACPFEDDQKIDETCECDVDCVGKTVEIGQCDCATGKKPMMYVIEQEAQADGKACPRADQEQFEQSCSDECPVDCVGTIEELGSCDCATKKKPVMYIIQQKELAGGAACPHADNEEFEQTCSDGCPVDCVGEENKGECDCASGMRFVAYKITQDEQNGGAPCPYANDETYEESCSNECPVNCQGDWVTTSICSAECGTGVQTQRFEIIQEAVGTGKQCKYEADAAREIHCVAEKMCEQTTQFDGVTTIITNDAIKGEQIQENLQKIIAQALPDTDSTIAINNLKYEYNLNVPSVPMGEGVFNEVKDNIVKFIQSNAALQKPTVQSVTQQQDAIKVSFSVTRVPLDPNEMSDLTSDLCQQSSQLCPSGAESNVENVVMNIDYTATISTTDPDAISIAQEQLAEREKLKQELETSGIVVLDLQLDLSDPEIQEGNAFNIQNGGLGSGGDGATLTIMIIVIVIILVIVILIILLCILKKVCGGKAWKNAQLLREPREILSTKAHDSRHYSAKDNRHYSASKDSREFPSKLNRGSRTGSLRGDGAVPKTNVGPNRTRSSRSFDQNRGGNEARAARVGPRAARTNKKPSTFEQRHNPVEVTKTRVGPRGKAPGRNRSETKTETGEIVRQRIGPQKGRGPAKTRERGDIARTSVGPARKRQTVATSSVSKAHADEVSRTTVGPRRGVRGRGRGAKPRSVDAARQSEPGEISRTNVGPRRNARRTEPDEISRTSLGPRRKQTRTVGQTDATITRSTYEADIAKQQVGPSRGRPSSRSSHRTSEDGITRTRLGPAAKSESGVSGRSGAKPAPGARVERTRERGVSRVSSGGTENIQTTRLGPGPTRIRVRDTISIDQNAATQSSGVTRSRLGPNRSRVGGAAGSSAADGVQRTRIGPARAGRGGAPKARRLGPSAVLDNAGGAARTRVGPTRVGGVGRARRLGPGAAANAGQVSSDGVQRTRMGPRAAGRGRGRTRVGGARRLGATNTNARGTAALAASLQTQQAPVREDGVTRTRIGPARNSSSGPVPRRLSNRRQPNV